MKHILLKCMFTLLFIGFPADGAAAQPEAGSAPVHPFTLEAVAAVRPDVHYVPTPMAVVRKMLEMAEVDEKDLLYDLGSGDGRIVITAALERGALGVGIDIDPERIKESMANAEIANVTDRVRFFQRNLFETDLSQASVVTLYLLPWINLELRPKLLRELKPGTRIVSHSFDMGDWEPDQFEMVEGDQVFSWVVPANVSGTWEWTTSGPQGKEAYRLELEQTFQEVAGTFSDSSGSMPLEDAMLVGERLEFRVERNVGGRYESVRYEARVQDNTMEIAAVGGTADAAQARRDPHTVASIAY